MISLGRFKILILWMFISFLSVDFSYSQTRQTVDSIQCSYQACLDKGQFMSDCSKDYYLKMDSLLNVVYSRLRLNIDSVEKTKLKKEQREWLLKRDSYFRKIQNEHKKNNVGGAIMPQDDIMEMYDEYAMVVKERVLYLIESLRKTKIK